MTQSPLDWCRRQEEASLDLLQELVAIDSGPGQREGIEAVAAVADRTLASLDLETVVERVGPGLPVVVATTPGRRHLPRTLLLAHLDTVFPAGTAARRPFTVASGRVFGPGVADMKGGFVSLWLALGWLRHAGLLHRRAITVLVNTDEEIGSLHSRPLIESHARAADVALSFEPARPDGSLVTRRRGHRRYRLEVEGRAAHTGVEPEAGANAIVTLARWITAIDELQHRLPRETTVTVSLVEGGTSINTVPDRAVASIDVRVPDMEAADTTEELLEGADVVAIPGTTARFVRWVERPPMTEVSGVDRIVSAIEDAAAELGLSATFTATGGGSDAGITASAGVPSVDGLGPVGGRYHTEEEFLVLSTLAERAALAAETIRRVSPETAG